MKTLLLVLITLALAITPCLGTDIVDLKNILIEKGQPDYFPSNATYKRLPNICSKQKCFAILTVDYVSTTRKGIRRLAVFTTAGEYLGCYSGLDELPVGVQGNKLQFKNSKYGDTVIFEGNDPPHSIWVDGMTYKFEKL